MKKQPVRQLPANFREFFVECRVGISKAADSYGYNRVVASSARADKAGVAVGGGYDLHTTALCEHLAPVIQDRLDALPVGTKSVGDYPRPLYGVNFKGHTTGSGYTYTSASVDGGCGFSSIQEVFRAAGVEVTEVYSRTARASKMIGWMVRPVAVFEGGAA
jgi:hypothetical protein